MSSENKALPTGIIHLVWKVVDQYGPAGVLVLTLMVGMWYTTSWLREESKRNDQGQQEMIAKFSATLKDQQEHFDKMLDREHKEFRTSLTEITKTFNEVMLNNRRAAASGGPGQ